VIDRIRCITHQGQRATSGRLKIRRQIGESRFNQDFQAIRELAASLGNSPRSCCLD
jgi:hypothetical protein